MTFLQELNQFLNENPDFNDFVFRTETLNEAKALIKTLYKLGYYWNKDTPYTDEEVEKRWKQKKKDTCISIGTLNFPDKKQLFNGRQGMFTNQGRMVVAVNTLFEEVDGETVEDVANAKYSNTRKLCPKCNNELSKKAKFCTSCGYKFEELDLEKEMTKVGADNRTVDNLYKEHQIPVQESKPVINNSIPTPIIKDANNGQDSPENELVQNLENTFVADKMKQISAENKKTGYVFNEQKEIAEKTQKNAKTVPNLCKILGVTANQNFTINNFAYNSDNCVFRINENGFREKKVGPNAWFITNNEQELAYIIENISQVNKL